MALDLTLPALSHVRGGRGWRSGLRAATLLVLAMLVSACTAGPTSPTGPEGGTGAPRGAEASSAGAAPTSAAPVTPVATCANLAQRPEQPASGCGHRVDPDVRLDLADKVEARPAGTTFWLGPRALTPWAPESSRRSAPKAGNTYVGAPGRRARRAGPQPLRVHRHRRERHDPDAHRRGVRGTRQDEGVVNHDSGNGWVIEDITIERQQGRRR